VPEPEIAPPSVRLPVRFTTKPPLLTMLAVPSDPVEPPLPI